VLPISCITEPRKGLVPHAEVYRSLASQERAASVSVMFFGKLNIQLTDHFVNYLFHEARVRRFDFDNIIRSLSEFRIGQIFARFFSFRV
jgi:hypothetical protein